MPIRFRCSYCNQLMGIARRKAGTVVRCPTCSGSIVVPTSGISEPEKSPLRDEPEPAMFERSDFAAAFEAAAAEPAAVAAAAQVPAPPPAPLQGAWVAGHEPRLDVDPVDLAQAGFAAAGGSPGIQLSRLAVTLLAVLVIVALALAFGAGLWVGVSLKPAPDQARIVVPDAAPSTLARIAA